MKGELEPGPTSAGLAGVLRLTAGFAVLALALLAGLVVLDVLPRDQVAPVGRRIVLLALIVALASAAIAGLAGSGRRH
ncbi:MAG TPA: hypothetical protein VFO71_02055 [Gemmatimonadales bacterium]|nr:hypothetical protein [Gemmatimonadales bacterium]